MSAIYRLRVTKDHVEISDTTPRPKASKNCYSIVCPAHIPGVEVTITASEFKESMTLKIPFHLMKLIPVLAACHEIGASAEEDTDTVASGSGTSRQATKVPDIPPHETDKDPDKLELPAGMWALIIVLKLLTEKDVSEELVFACDEDEHACTAADIVKTADWLGCVVVSRRIKAWLRKSLMNLVLAGTSSPGDERTTRALIMCDALQHLSDGAFSIKQGNKKPHEGLIKSLSEAVRLPAMLCVKWLRADCFKALDLSSPGSPWTPQLWRGIAACMHAVPGLQQLRVSLPRSEQEGPPKQGASFTFRSTQAPIFGASATPQPSEAAASQDTIASLMHAVIALPQLQLLDLGKSHVRASSVTAVACVLTSAATTLSELHLPSWLMDCHSIPADAFQRPLFAALSRLKQLKLLGFQDWAAFVGGRAHSSAAAMGRSLPQLQRVEVGRYPCEQCKGASGGCQHYPAPLVFEQV